MLAIRSTKAREAIIAYAFIAPTFIFVLAFTIYPAGASIFDSLYRPGIFGQASEFVGLQNFKDLLDETHFIGTNFRLIFRNTVVFSFALIAISVPLACLFAIAVNHRTRFTGFWRFGLFYPSLIPTIGAATIWAFLYTPNSGFFNVVLTRLGLSPVMWVGDPIITLWSVIAVMVWKQSGYFMIYYLAGLQGISGDVYEASVIDGANVFQRFWYMTLPLLRRTHQFVLTIGIIGAFQQVEQLAALGNGAPNHRSNLLLYYITQRLPEPRNWGYVNAMSVVIIGIVLVFTVTNFLIFERDKTW